MGCARGEEDTSGAPDTAGEVDPAAMGAAELKDLHERQLMAKAAGGRGSHSPVMDKAERLKDLWGQLAQSPAAATPTASSIGHERANEARQLMDQSQVEMEVGRSSRRRCRRSSAPRTRGSRRQPRIGRPERRQSAQDDRDGPLQEGARE